MARRKNAEPEQTPASVPPQKGIELIERQITEGQSILQGTPFDRSAYDMWGTLTESVVVRAFGRNSPEHYDYLGTNRTVMLPLNESERAFEQRLKGHFEAEINKLRVLVKILKDHIDLAEPPVAPAPARNAGTKVFLVHGRDPLRHEVARFIDKLKLDVTILDEQPNQGRTLIKKFEDHAEEARFAVVLLTADDVGCLEADLAKKVSAEDKLHALRPRARQNVIFELGYFRAMLGEGYVCALCEEGIEIPSDFSGVSFIPLAGDWGLRLARELKAAHLPVDMNDAIS